MIWKALSDSTRRSILDLLKSAPRTTGEISGHFSSHLSRFAIMKHLGILEKAQLITTRKEGKFRWNYLNTKPIQKTYDEWVNQLIQLQYYTDQTSTAMADTPSGIISNSMEMTVTINAVQDAVWRALTQDIGQWWLSEFYEGKGTQDFILDPKLGGLMYEDTGNDEGVVWAAVIAVQAPHHLMLKGHLSPELGGPAISFFKFILENKKQKTLLTLHHTVMGVVSRKRQREIEKQWQKLLEEGLKKYLES